MFPDVLTIKITKITIIKILTLDYILQGRIYYFISTYTYNNYSERIT